MLLLGKLFCAATTINIILLSFRSRYRRRIIRNVARAIGQPAGYNDHGNSHNIIMLLNRRKRRRVCIPIICTTIRRLSNRATGKDEILRREENKTGTRPRRPFRSISALRFPTCSTVLHLT